MPDIEEPFVPFDSGLFVDPYESRYIAQAIANGDVLTTLFADLS
jgi:hypothetical protein